MLGSMRTCVTYSLTHLQDQNHRTLPQAGVQLMAGNMRTFVADRLTDRLTELDSEGLGASPKNVQEKVKK